MFCSEELMKRAGNIPRDHLVSLGTCFGKFTKTQRFRLHVTALDYLAPYAKVSTRHGSNTVTPPQIQGQPRKPDLPLTLENPTP